jgi:hypothetical protein
LSRQSLALNTKLHASSDISVTLDRTKAFHGGGSLLICTSTSAGQSIIYIPIFELVDGSYPDLSIEAKLEQIDPGMHLGLYLQSDEDIIRGPENILRLGSWESLRTEFDGFQATQKVSVGIWIFLAEVKEQGSTPLVQLGELRVFPHSQTPTVATSFQESSCNVKEITKDDDGGLVLTLEWKDEPLVEKWEVFREEKWIGTAFCSIFQDMTLDSDQGKETVFYRLAGYDPLGRQYEERTLAVALDPRFTE